MVAARSRLGLFTAGSGESLQGGYNQGGSWASPRRGERDALNEGAAS